MKTPVNKILAFSTVALLVINVVLVFFLWKNKKHEGEPGIPVNRGDWMVKELKLNDQQKAEHKKIKDDHFARLKPVNDSITFGRSHLYSLLKDSVTNDSLVHLYAGIVGEKHTLASIYTFEHFKKIRAICDPQQQVKLDSLIQKIVQDMANRNTRPKEK